MGAQVCSYKKRKEIFLAEHAVEIEGAEWIGTALKDSKYKNNKMYVSCVGIELMRDAVAYREYSKDKCINSILGIEYLGVKDKNYRPLGIGQVPVDFIIDRDGARQEGTGIICGLRWRVEKDKVVTYAVIRAQGCWIEVKTGSIGNSKTKFRGDNKKLLKMTPEGFIEGINIKLAGKEIAMDFMGIYQRNGSKLEKLGDWMDVVEWAELPKKDIRRSIVTLLKQNPAVIDVYDILMPVK